MLAHVDQSPHQKDGFSSILQPPEFQIRLTTLRVGLEPGAKCGAVDVELHPSPDPMFAHKELKFTES